MGKLNNKIAIITGAASGNGNGAAKVLAENGAQVILTDINDKVFAAARNIIESGHKAAAYKMDVSSWAEIRQVTEQVFNRFGRIDILVNNAGICKIIPFLQIDDEIRDMMFNINIKGVWNCSKAVISYMIKQNYGKIINLSSVTGPMVVDAGETAYATTKAAIWGLTKALAIEFAKSNITVNAICPGYIKTPMAESIARESNPYDPQSVLDSIASAIPMGRLGTIEELGDLVAFLASDESRYITGTQIVIDGGSTLPESFGAVHVENKMGGDSKMTY